MQPKLVLEAQKLTKRFGGLTAVRNVDIAVPSDCFVAIIGPNGAGKSTFLNLLTGLSAPTTGKVFLNGRDVTSAPVHRRTAAGLSRTFQHGRLFPRLNVIENVMLGAAASGEKTASVLEDRAITVLRQLDLHKLAKAEIKSLSYGTRRMVELGRTLASDPRILLLDEPAAGLNLGEVGRLAEQLTELRRQRQLSVLLIEHNMGMVMNLAEYIFVLNFGEKIAEGNPDEIRSNTAVLEAYLGRGFDNA